MSMFLPAIFFVMRPSCGRRFSAMLSALMILMRAMIAVHELRGARARDVELAVDAVADDDLLLLRLDVDVARALLHRLEEERVDPADDRRLVVGVEDVARGLLVDARVVALELARRRPRARRRG